ncbi:hypothetical protein OsI_12522 [Oryza sativa Indica Group]|uniref:Uncharacterized protein n=1 Tax=Oryza sativa subsp. indica TaxID=39946 RepID=B8AM50_ORYSI|nr:hypothetical protein OsI_12522 [Oryza sativa Indica Group]
MVTSPPALDRLGTSTADHRISFATVVVLRVPKLPASFSAWNTGCPPLCHCATGPIVLNPVWTPPAAWPASAPATTSVRRHSPLPAISSWIHLLPRGPRRHRLHRRRSFLRLRCSPTAGLCISFLCRHRPWQAAIKLATPHVTCSFYEQRRRRKKKKKKKKKGKTMLEVCMRAPCA